MHRTPTGKRIELTERDFEIFKLLDQYRYLPSTYIHAFVGGASVTRFKERLGHLYHESGHLDRPRKQWEFANARHRPAVYEIGASAVEALREHGVTGRDKRSFLSGVAHRQFLHSLMICQVLASLELGVRANPKLRFIAWPEILARAPEQTRVSANPIRIPLPSNGYLVPDGLFGLEYDVDDKKAYRFFALEADRGTTPVARSNGTQTSYMGKLASYQEIVGGQLYKRHWGISNFFLLTVMTNETRLAEAMRRFSEGGGSPLFLFKATGSLRSPEPQLLSEAWKRAGMPALAIDA